MTPSKSTTDEHLRQYALDNLRAVVRRLKYADVSAEELRSMDWRQKQLSSAARWAQIAEALRPEPAPVELVSNDWCTER